MTVKTLKNIYLTFVQFAKQAWLLPTTLANFSKKKRAELVKREREVERLDRIRNPDKYRGKNI